MEEKKKLVILTGPTAAGKTKLSIRLAQTIGGEIISADSMQVYRHMDIGSAKIKPEEMQGVRHHLIDILEPVQEFDVHTFQKLAKESMQEIWSRGAIPILVGGTGFYIQAVLYDIDFTENGGDGIRAELEALAREKGVRYMHEMLSQIDPESAAQIHENNVKRVIRAIEYYRQTGQKISAHNETERKKTSPYLFSYFVLEDERPLLYDRIDRRVDEMVEKGLVEEVNALVQMGCRRESTAMQGLGYKEILDYLDGACELSDAIYRIKRDTRHFAKRQLTWFRRERDVTWINRTQFGQDEEKMLAYMLSQLKEKNIWMEDLTWNNK